MSDTGLRYLFEAFNAGSMRAASDRLNVAASSISRQIAQLEDTYGLALIEKGRRGIRLTHAGEIVIAHYRNQLADREALRAKLEELRAVRSGHVVLAVGEGFLGASFTQMIEGFSRSNPHIRLELLIGSSQDIVRMVMDDDAHIGLVFQAPHDMKLSVRQVIAQPLMAIVSPDHPLAGEASVTIRQLAGHPLCLAPHHFRLRQILGEAEARNATFLEPSITTGSIHVMREMAKSGAALTILPQVSLWKELEEGHLVSVAIADDEMEDTTISLVLRAGRQLEGAPGRLCKIIEAQLRQWSRPPRPAQPLP
ncbi:MAG TPA: LysR family transcriptional regulator [Novosphingobium sp.]|nr:LysR family transcriptional regulator [Novosphingobium sp.]